MSCTVDCVLVIVTNTAAVSSSCQCANCVGFQEIGIVVVIGNLVLSVIELGMLNCSCAIDS